MEEVVTTEYLEPKILEKRVWNLNHLFLGIFIAVAFIAISIFIIVNYEFDITNSLILILSVVIIYSGVLFFLIEPKILREIESTVVHKVEKPVIRQVPVERKIFVDRPVEVVKEVHVPVERKIFVDRPVEVVKEVQTPPEQVPLIIPTESKKTLNIPKYDFVASEETRVYHKRTCRFAKLIKRKYKLVSNEEKDFIKEKFTPCKVCIDKKPKKQLKK